MICGTGLDLLQSSGEFPCAVCRTSGQQHLLQWLQALGAQEMQWVQVLDKGPWQQMYRMPGNCMPLDGRPEKEVQVGPDKLEVVASFCYLGDMLSTAGGCELSRPQHMCKLPGRSSRICCQLSLHSTSLSRHVAVCKALVCGAQCSTPVRRGHWQSQTSSTCSEMTGQWSDRSAMSGSKTLLPPSPMSYLCSLALRIWTSFWRKEGFIGMDMWNAPMVQSRQPLTYRLMESMGLGGSRWHGNSWHRGIAESGSSRLSTLMIDIPGDLVWELPCMQQAIYLEGGPLDVAPVPARESKIWLWSWWYEHFHSEIIQKYYVDTPPPTPLSIVMCCYCYSVCLQCMFIYQAL